MKIRSFVILSLFLSLCFASKAEYKPVLMRLVADGNSMQNETTINFDSSATFNYDSLYDAPSLGVNAGFLNIVTRTANIDYEINALPALTQNISVPVKITTGITGTYQIYATDLQNLPEGARVSLFDTYTNSTYDLRAGTAPCTLTDTEAVARFILTILITPLQGVSANFVNPACFSSADGFIYASAPGNGSYNYYWKDSLNTIVRTSLNKTGPDTLFGTNAGLYRVDVNTSGTNDNATVYFNLEGSQSAHAGFTVNNHQLNLSNGYATAHFTNTSQNGQTYWWDFGDGMGSSNQQATHSYNQIGTYTVTLTATNTSCSDISTFTDVITINGTTGISNANETAFIINRDAEGLYLILPSSYSQRTTISVINLVGQRICNDVEVYSAGQKIYLDKNLPENEILFIRAMNISGSSATQKFLK